MWQDVLSVSTITKNKLGLLDLLQPGDGKVYPSVSGANFFAGAASGYFFTYDYYGKINCNASNDGIFIFYKVA